MSGFRWTAGARLLAQLITWAITLVVIRILTPADYGLLAMATVFLAFLSMVSEFGLGPAVVQSRDVEVATLRKVLGVVLIIHALLTALVFIAAPLVAGFFNEPRLIAIVRALSFQFVLAAFAVVPDALLQRKLDFRRRSLLDLASSIVGGVTTLGLALAGHGVWSLVLGSLASLLCKVLGVNALAPFPHLPSFTGRGLRSLVTFGGHVTATQLLWFIYTQIDVVIAGRWLGKDLVGFYSVAMHVASLPNQRIAGIINQIAFPAFARIQHDLRAVGEHLLAGVRVLCCVAFPLLWGMSAVAPELVSVVLGAKWAPATLPLQILGLVMPVRMVANFVPNAVQGIGRSDILLGNAVFAVVIAPATFLIGVQWGLVGLSVAWLVWVPVVFVQSMLRSMPALGLRLGALLRAMAPAAAAGVLMYASVAAARWALAPHLGHSPLLLGALVAVGALGYCAASWVLNRAGVRELLGLARELTRVRKPAREEP
jgi:teichuronic acid exporter